MDIRQLLTIKPRFAQIVERRFTILHNLRQLDELEPDVAAYLKDHGRMTVATKTALFDLSLNPDRSRVDGHVKETKTSEGLNYLTMPEPVQLFCNALKTLHRNQQELLGQSPDEVRQIKAEFLELAPNGELTVERGEFRVQIKIADGKLLLNAL